MTEIGALDIQCPTCGAGPGAPCQTQAGQEKPGFHRRRETAAQELRTMEASGQDRGIGLSMDAIDCEDILCAACGHPCAGEESSIYPTEGAEEEVPICSLCELSEVDVIRTRIEALRRCAQGKLCDEALACLPEVCEGCEHHMVPEEEPDVSSREIERRLHCQLPDHEIVDRTLAILRLEREIERIKAAAKEEIKPRQESISLLKTQIRAGDERPISCLERRYYRTGELTVHRLDTGEEIERRALTAEERQQELPFEGEGEGKDRLEELQQEGHTYDCAYGLLWGESDGMECICGAGGAPTVPEVTLDTPEAPGVDDEEIEL